MTEVQIKVQVPFAFCADCKRKDIDENKLLAGCDVIDQVYECYNTQICKNAVELYKARTAEGEPA